MTLFTQWFPDPRNRNDNWSDQTYKKTVENGGRTIRFTTNDSGIFPWGTSRRAIELPAGSALNLCVTLEVEGTANLDWGYIFMMYDASKSASDFSSVLCQWGSPVTHSAKRFVVPESGKVKFQYVLPQDRRREPGGIRHRDRGRCGSGVDARERPVVDPPRAHAPSTVLVTVLDDD